MKTLFYKIQEDEKLTEKEKEFLVSILVEGEESEMIEKSVQKD